MVVSLPWAIFFKSSHIESTPRYSSQYISEIFRWLNYLVCSNNIWFFEIEYYLLSGELQQVNLVVMKHYESFLHQNRRSRVYSHLGKMIRTSKHRRIREEIIISSGIKLQLLGVWIYLLSNYWLSLFFVLFSLFRLILIVRREECFCRPI